MHEQDLTRMWQLRLLLILQSRAAVRQREVVGPQPPLLTKANPGDPLLRSLLDHWGVLMRLLQPYYEEYVDIAPPQLPDRREQVIHITFRNHNPKE